MTFRSMVAFIFKWSAAVVFVAALWALVCFIIVLTFGLALHNPPRPM
jgi:hypothetical protein